MNKIAVIQITDAIPLDTMCERLGVTPHSIRYARTTGIFPASWYAPLADLCVEAHVECPRSAFNWKGQSHNATGDAA